MAHSRCSPLEFIQNSFSPIVAVICSPSVDHICQKNNLGFIELLQPFCRLTSEVKLKEPSGSLISVKNLRVAFVDVNTRPPQPTLARKFLNESVSSLCDEKQTRLEIGNIVVDVPLSVPWFDSWRETFLQVQSPSDHEFTKHNIACMFVTSTLEPNPKDSLIYLSQQIQQTLSVSSNKLPKWFCPSILRYYVLVHEPLAGEQAVAEAVFETMKQSYGPNHCFFLPINSRPPGGNTVPIPDLWSPYLSNSADLHNTSSSSDSGPSDVISVSSDFSQTSSSNSTPAFVQNSDGKDSSVILHPLSPLSEDQKFPRPASGKSVVDGNSKMINPNVWSNEALLYKQYGAYLTAHDIDRIKLLVSEFIGKALIPYVESQIQSLHDIVANKKGVSRSLLSATKRWFGASKPGTPAASVPATSTMYSSDAPELQSRRLADLYFMFGAYALAYQTYHAAKRDFNADGAWLFYAGALEMAALSAFIMGTDLRKALEYSEESITTYLNSCGLPQFATRATLFTSECLKEKGMYCEAAKQLIRMTSEDSDLRSALLLEQASYCYLHSRKPRMPRKYAFNLVLAGHRFNKAGQKKHTLRCYNQAHQVYQGKEWSLAEDHIHLMIGRQAASLQQIQDSAAAFSRLLSRSSRQVPAQQALNLKEYLIIQQQLSDNETEAPILPLPLVDQSSIEVLLGPDTLSSPNNSMVPVAGVTFHQKPAEISKWCKVEEQLVGTATGSLPLTFKPSLSLLSDSTNNTVPPVSVCKEPINVNIGLKNLLHIAIPIQKLKLMWSCTLSDGSVVSDDDSVAETHCQESIILEPDCTTQVVLQVKPLKPGSLLITGISYCLASTVPSSPTESITVRGRQLLKPNGPPVKQTKDKMQGQPIFAPDYRLQLNILENAPCIHVFMLSISCELLCGELRHVSVLMKNTGNLPVSRILFSSPTPQFISLHSILPNSHSNPPPVKQKFEPCFSIPMERPLEPNGELSFDMWIRAPETKGAFSLDVLFYCEYYPLESNQKPRYRLVRHSWNLTVFESLNFSVIPTRSCQSSKSNELINFQLQVKNNNQPNDILSAEIDLVQVSLFSPCWQLCGKAFVPEKLTLQSQQSLYLVFQATRPTDNQTGGISSDINLSNSDEPTSLHSPFFDFLRRSISHSSQTSSQENKKDLNFGTTLDAVLIVRWKGRLVETGGKNRISMGQHHLRMKQFDVMVTCPPIIIQPKTKEPLTLLKIFGPDRNCDHVLAAANQQHELDASAIQQKLVMFTISHQQLVNHNFNENRLCMVPVKISLRNCSDSQLDVKVMAVLPPSRQNPVASTEGSSSFLWLGRTIRIISLKSYALYSVQLLAAISYPGSYNLGSRLVVSAKNEFMPNLVPQCWKFDTVVMVNNASS
ncbi:unnamed protein product [Bemisia tabaci]|uniref:Trafficking protein particle complex subunit 8 n=1 Tax=Bemisia tabaci TaxID=7038 RepID=A0A9P0EWJ1_BEMTA|nr:unnamed protein product [Bemisia tabaci]